MASLSLRSVLNNQISQQFLCCLCGSLTSRRLGQPTASSYSKLVKKMSNRKPVVAEVGGTMVKNVVLLKDVEKKAIPKSRTFSAVHITCNNVAGRISKILVNDPNLKDNLLFEINPGLGILTKALLRVGITKLRLLESDPTFLPGLEKIRDENPNKLEVVEANFFRLPKLSYIDRITLTDSIGQLLRGVQVKLWTETPPLVIFATVPQTLETPFMRYILISLAKLNDLYSYGRVQLVFFISAKEYQRMTSMPKPNRLYQMVYILYNTFFDIDLLAKESKKSFHGIRNIKTLKLPENDHLYLVRLTPKKDLLSIFNSPEHLREFYCFVKQHSVRRTAYVINSLEHWIPNCGPRLIKEGYTIYTRFGDLSHSQYLNVFLQFSSWPEYTDSQFRALLLKLDLREDHGGNEDDDVVA